jgi:hypothetical protein
VSSDDSVAVTGVIEFFDEDDNLLEDFESEFTITDSFSRVSMTALTDSESAVSYAKVKISFNDDGTYYVDLIQFEKFAGATSSTAQNNFGTVAINYLDSPATTSSTTYKTQLSSFSNNATVYVNTGTIYSSITLMEIKA